MYYGAGELAAGSVRRLAAATRARHAAGDSQGKNGY
eukprot:COSAG01_NODE_35727_length_527_cov_1.413551_2_plen_35_part_01